MKDNYAESLHFKCCKTYVSIQCGKKSGFILLFVWFDLTISHHLIMSFGLCVEVVVRLHSQLLEMYRNP